MFTNTCGFPTFSKAFLLNSTFTIEFFVPKEMRACRKRTANNRLFFFLHVGARYRLSVRADRAFNGQTHHVRKFIPLSSIQ